jgi:hypothetical protein
MGRLNLMVSALVSMSMLSNSSNKSRLEKRRKIEIFVSFEKETFLDKN